MVPTGAVACGAHTLRALLLINGPVLSTPRPLHLRLPPFRLGPPPCLPGLFQTFPQPPSPPALHSTGSFSTRKPRILFKRKSDHVALLPKTLPRPMG